MTRILWFSLGGFALVLAVLGAVLPLLPTTPFLLVAAYAFAKSSPAWHDWLVEHPRFGPAIRDWRDERAISRRAKTWAVLAMLAAIALSVALEVRAEVLAVQAVVMAAAAAFILSRPSPSGDDDV